MKYLAFFDDNHGTKTGEYKIYEDDGKGWYIRPNTTFGFDYATINQYGKDSLKFLHSDTLDGINKEIDKANHIRKYGYGKEGDCVCPNCGYKYNLDYYDHNDGYYTSAIIEDFSTTIKCICGIKFQANIDVKVSFHTKVIT